MVGSSQSLQSKRVPLLLCKRAHRAVAGRLFLQSIRQGISVASLRLHMTNSRRSQE